MNEKGLRGAPRRERDNGLRPFFPAAVNSFIGKARGRAVRELTAFKRLARHKFARAVYSLPSFTGRDPQRRITTFKQYCRKVEALPNGDGSASQAWYLPLRPPEMVYRSAPVSLNETDAAKFCISAMRYQYGFSFEMPEVFLACVPGARIYGRDFLVFSPHNHIFFESALSQAKVLERSGILDTIIWPAPRLSRASGCLMAQETPGAY